VERAWRVLLDPRAVTDVIGFLLPLRTHRPWWQRWIEPYRDGLSDRVPFVGMQQVGPKPWPKVRVHHPPTRFKYGHPGNPRGIGVVEPNFQTVGIVFRRNRT
jgi:hypothetical protein